MDSLFDEITSLLTEQNNPLTSNIDNVNTREVLELINNEDSHVAPAVREEIDHITQAVDQIIHCFRQGGRLFYVGSGTSGRLGVVDASECPPTFGVPPDMVQAIIAGGKEAVFRSQEGAEDSVKSGADILDENGITARDVVCGIAASGRTPFVRGALAEAHKRGIYTILITTNSRSHLAQLGIDASCIIAPQVGPEVIAGSTRMKSGTAQKLVLNMLSTASMIALGKSFGNIMVDLQLTNAKLVERAKKIVMTVCDVDYKSATKAIEAAEGSVKTAIVMVLLGIPKAEAERQLQRSNGFARRAVDMNDSDSVES